MAGAPSSARVRGARPVWVAPFWRRALADLVDLAILAGLMALTLKLGVWSPPDLPPARYDWIDHAVEVALDHRGRFIGPLMMGLTLHLGYRLLGYLVWGKTLGQRLLGLALIGRHGDPITPLQATLHPLLGALGLALLSLGYLWASVDIKRQTFAEHLSGTLLILSRRRGA